MNLRKLKKAVYAKHFPLAWFYAMGDRTLPLFYRAGHGWWPSQRFLSREYKALVRKARKSAWSSARQEIRERLAALAAKKEARK